MRRCIIYLTIMLPSFLQAQGYSYLGKHFFFELSPATTSVMHSGSTILRLLRTTNFPDDFFSDGYDIWGIEIQPKASLHYIIGRRATVMLGLTANRPLIHNDDYIGPFIHQTGLYTGFRYYQYKKQGYLAPIGKYFETQILSEKASVIYPDWVPDLVWKGIEFRSFRINMRWGYELALSRNLLAGFGVQLSSPILAINQQDAELAKFLLRDYLYTKMFGVYFTIAPLF